MDRSDDDGLIVLPPGAEELGDFRCLAHPRRIIPFNILLFWVILIAAVGLTVAKLMGRTP